MKKTAVIEGGFSREKAISIKSAQTVFENLDLSKFSPIKVLIDQNEWTAYDQEGSYPINKNDFSYVKNGLKNYFSYAFIVIHGTPGEDGKLQGYLDMIGVPYNTSSTSIMALTFQKFHCNKFLKNFGIEVPDSVLITSEENINEKSIVENVKFPCFVKPTDGGSSFGVTKVKKHNKLLPAIHKAFKHGSEVIVEQSIEGREATCGAYGNRNGIKVLPVTEIISENEYFDYDAKYNGKSREITPGDFGNEITSKIKVLTKKIYKILDMKGIVRMDYIVNKKGDPLLIEINSIPGLSKESIVPQMLKVDNINLQSILG